MEQLKSQRDVPGTQREYETIYILRPDATTEQIHDVNTRVRRVIENTGGKLIRVDNWGKRKLAYEIKKQLKGIYLYWLYLGESKLVAEIERNLRMLDLVIRYYTVKVVEGVDPEARPTQMDEESFAATATTVPDEEDAYLGRGGYEDAEPADLPDREGETGAKADAVEHKADAVEHKADAVEHKADAVEQAQKEAPDQPGDDAPAPAAVEDEAGETDDNSSTEEEK
jgi:small subunit ribosomal protein S6